MPRATLRRPFIAAVVTFALGAASAETALAHTSERGAEPRLEIELLAARGHDVAVTVWASSGSLRNVVLTLRRDGDVIAHRQLDLLTPRHRTVVFTMAGTGGRLSVMATAAERHRPARPAERHTTSTTSS